MMNFAALKQQRGWTEDRTEALEALWREGKSATQISKLIGNASRNACLGKLYRMGIARQRPGMKFKPTPRADQATVPARGSRVVISGGWVRAAKADAPLPRLRVVEPVTESKVWEDRLPGECAWPVRVLDGLTWSCCAPVDRTRWPESYCARHADLMFKPKQPPCAKSDEDSASPATRRTPSGRQPQRRSA